MKHPCQMSLDLYPTMDSMVDVVRYIESQLPISNPNELFPLLMTYHNTLIKAMEDVSGNESCNLLEDVLTDNLERDGYQAFQEYKAILLKDFDDIGMLAGDQINVMKLNHERLSLVTPYGKPFYTGAVEGQDFKRVHS